MRKNVNREQIKEILSGIDITEYLSYRDLLRDLYKKSKSAIAKYSYLKFAEDIGFSSTNVVRLMIIGERNLTVKAAAKMMRALDIQGNSRRYLTSLIHYNNASKPVERERFFRQLMGHKAKSTPRGISQEQMDFFSEWYNPVILELVAHSDFDGSAEWVQKNMTFPLRLEQIKKSLEMLEKLKMIQSTGKNTWNKVKDNIVTDREIDAIAVVRYHQKMIEIAKESITRVNEKERDIRALTFSIPNSSVPLVKSKVQEFLMEILRLEEENGSDEGVFQMNVQFFPFTKK